MDSVGIHITITLPDRADAFEYEFDSKTYELKGGLIKAGPQWARLDHNKCSHCTLDSISTIYCPLAIQLHDLVERFHDTRSIDEVEVEIASDSRRVIQKTTLQYAIGSLLEVIYPACGCPKTKSMRPLARFHVPSSSEEEKVYRIASMYLMAQYFREQTDKTGDFEFQELIDYYAEMSILNKAVASRIRSATRSDSVKNAIALMDMYSTLVPLMLEDGLVELRGFFQDHLPEGSGGTSSPTTSNYIDRIKSAMLELAPLEDEEDNDEPAWLADVKGSKVPDNQPSQSSQTRQDQKAIDEILKKSSLTLELMPTEPEEEKPKTGKAIFKLPED